MTDAIIEIDARRLFCPMPVIRLQDCINKEPAGTLVRIVCTDPGVMNDIPTWCRINGHQVVSSQEEGFEFILLVGKGLDGP
jgi:TusA-related sulfurtransferase